MHPHSKTRSGRSTAVVVHPGKVDHANNPHPRAPVAVLLDCSSSMGGPPMAALQRGLKLFFDDLQQDPLARLRCDPSIWTFGGRVEQAMPWESTMVGMTPLPDLRANGGTPLGEAVLTAIQEVESRREAYRAAAVAQYKPWVVIMSDGHPTDDWEYAAAELSARARLHNWNVLCLGAGPNADLQCLARFSPCRAPLVFRDADTNHCFAQFFRWLSASLRASSRRATTSEPQLQPLPADIAFNA